MERLPVVAKPFVVLVAICLVAILATVADAGRDVPSVSKNEVNGGQTLTTTTTPPIPSVSKDEVNGGQSLTTTTTTNPLPPAQVHSPYMAYAPEGLYENSLFFFDHHFGFPWFWGFHGFPFHHFWGFHGLKAEAGSKDVPIGSYEGGQVPNKVGGKVAGKTP